MALETEVKGASRLAQIFGGLSPALARALKATAADVGRRFYAVHRKEHLSARKVAATGPLFGTRRGFVGLRRIEVTGNRLSNVSLHAFIKSTPAAAWEEGREIHAKSGKSIAVPLDEARTSTGKLRKPAARWLRERILVPIKVGQKTFLAKVNPRKQGRERLTFLFHLVKSVRTRPRFGFFESWRGFKPKAMNLFGKKLGFALRAVRAKAGKR